MFNTLTRNIQKKIFLFSLMALVSITNTFAAVLAPVISSFSPTSGTVGTSVIISGSNFNATASSDIVFFGATMATVTSASTTSLTVTVPAGATYAPITVLNGSAHLSGYSKNQFIVTFTGTGGISTSTFGSPQTFATGSTPLFVAVADIDGDGKPDIVVIDQGGNDVGVYLNKSSGGSITSASFAAEQTFSVGTGAAPSSIAIGDIDGDGKLDVVTSDISNGNVSVLRNTSSTGNISFAAHADFACGSNTDPNFVAIADFDGDGKPDLAVTDEATSKVSVFLNTTTSGGTTITFAAHADFGLPSEPGGIAVGDFDGDGKTDIAATIGGTTEISVLHNTSTGSGNINFAGYVNFTVGNSPIALTVSDVDGDGKLDIVAANAGDGTVSILRNNSSSGISFVAHQDITVDDPNIDPNESFYYILMNDLDGDGKPDMVVVDNDNKLYLLKNNSSSGSPSFGSIVTVPVGTSSFTLYGLAIGDLNSDGKPDMVADANGDSQIDVLQNNSAATPTINAPGGTVTVPSTPGGSTGSSTSFNISGSDLVANITATAPNNFQVSADNSNWGSTATITEIGGTVSNAPVYVRLTGAGNDGSTQSGNVALSSTNAATVDQAVSGTLLVSTITAPGGTITLSSTPSGTPGASTSFNISAANLSPSSGKLAIGAPTNVQVSPDNSTWSTAYLQSYSGGALTGTPVYVRLKGTGTVGTISGNVEISGGGASFTTTQQVSGTLNTPAASTTTTISASLNPSYTASPNNSVIFTASIYSSGTVNEGTVSFTSNGLAIPGGTDVPVSNGAAVVTTSFSVAGPYTIVATYNGDANYSSSTSSSLMQNVDLHPTTISSLTAVNSTTTNANSIQWTATFATSVSGLSTADFMLNTTGSISGASIASVSGSGTSWTITVNTGSGDGTIQLLMNSSSDVSPSVSNLSFSGDTYTIDKTAPTVTSFTATDANPTNAHTLDFQITFSEPVTGVDATDFSATTSNTSGGIISVSPVSSAVYDITVTSANGSGTYQLDLNSSGTGITDAAGNAISGGATGPTYTIDQRPPGLTSLIYTSTNTTNSAFAKPGDVITLSFGTNEAIQTPSVSIAGHTIGAINTGGNNYTASYTMGYSDAEGRIPFSLTVTDLVGNSTNETDVAAGDDITFDKTPPTATISAPSVASIGAGTSGTVSYTVTYADANFNTSNLTSSGITLNSTGTATGSVAVSGSGTSYTVTLSAITGSGTLGISVGAGYSSDLAGNADVGADASATFNVLGNDATLSNLAVSSGSLTPSFASGNTAYADSVGHTITNIMVTPTTNDPNATTEITVNGNLRRSIGVSPINIGDNNVVVTVTAADGVTTSTYTIRVGREGSHAAGLANLIVSGAALSPTFATATTGYTASVPYNNKSVFITPSVIDPTSTVTVNGTPVANKAASGAITLNIGSNTVTVVVTAQDGITTQTYTVNVIRGGNTNAFLTNLSVSNGAALSPSFTVQNMSYAASVASGVSSVTVTPTLADPNATIMVNGSPATSKTPSGAIALTLGSSTTINVVVTAQDGVTTQTYTILVNRPLSSNANLANLYTSKGAVSPAFTSSNTNYGITVASTTASFTVTPTIADPGASATVNTVSVTSGTASAPIALSYGANNVLVVVTAADGTQKDYNLTVTRSRSSIASLASMSLSGGAALSPAFVANTLTYSANVTNKISSVTLTANVLDRNSTFTVNRVPGTPKVASAPIALAVGPNTISVIVTAQDGVTTQTYTVNVTRAAGSTNGYDPGISVTKPTETPTLADDGIQVHQAVSPNGDGINDFLLIDNIIQYPENKLSIMNRNGQLIYEAQGYDNSSKVFDGHSNKNGQLQQPGTYFYQLDYIAAGITKHKTGYIVLKY